MTSTKLVNAKLDRLDAKLDRLNAKLDRLDTKLDRLDDIDRLPSITEIKTMGGYTHGLTHRTGYMVSLVGNKVIIPAATCTNKDWGMYYINHRPIRRETNVGVWYNPDDDNFYFDIGQWVETKEEAFALGRSNNQLAVYEIATGESIFL